MARRTYERPRVLTQEGEPTAWPHVVRYRLPGGRKVYQADRDPKRTRREEQILSHLRTAGLNVPRAARNGHYLVTMELGRDIRRPGETFPPMKRFSPATRREAYRQLAEFVGRMHAAGVAHNDLTPSNITWDGKRVGLIDFEDAKRFNKEWGKASVNSVLRHFAEDLLVMTNYAHDLGGEEPQAAFQRIVAHYPLPAAQKELLVQKLKNQLERELGRPSGSAGTRPP